MRHVRPYFTVQNKDGDYPKAWNEWGHTSDLHHGLQNDEDLTLLLSRETARGRQTERQIDREREGGDRHRQRDRQTNRGGGGGGRETETESDRRTETCRQTHRHKDAQTHRQRETEIEAETKRQRKRQKKLGVPGRWKHKRGETAVLIYGNTVTGTRIYFRSLRLTSEKLPGRLSPPPGPHTWNAFYCN